MGVTGLWPLLEPSCTPVTLESLEGKKLAVDVSIWIYQAQLGYSSDTKNPHLALLMNRIAKLLFYKIRPVFVFDGPGVPDLKRRVLNARRAERFSQDMLLTKNKKRHLEEVAKSQITGDNVDKAVKKLTSPSKKFKDDIVLFDIPSTSNAPVYDISDDEDTEIVVEKQVKPKTRSDLLNHLIEVKEHMRLSRLHPDMIPSNTDQFCKFQLQRVLQRNSIGRSIKALSQRELDSHEGSQVKLSVNDRQGNAHVISYDSDVQLVESPQKIDTPNEVGFQGNCLSDVCHLPSANQFEELAERAEICPVSFFSKTSMIEKLMKQRIGQQNAEAVRQDSWTSESSDDDDDEFIDVPELPSNSAVVPKEVEEQDWDPGLEDKDVVLVREPINLEAYDRERDSGIYGDIQAFLTKCGFPWVEAPGEAEAQCVELERLGLVQGVVSDDSDVWAFGVQNVYRHLFASGKNVQHYSASKVQSEIGLTQDQFISIAIISGGDYSVGFRGIGVVAAVELLAEFTSKSTFDADRETQILNVLRTLDNWLKFSADERRKDGPILRKIRKIIEDNNDLSHLEVADRSIVKAYVKPNVDSSSEVFRWKSVDIPGVQQLLFEKIGWGDDKFSKTVLQPFEKWNSFILGQTSYQRHITSYACQLTQSADEQRVSLSKRAVTALNKLKERLNSVELPELQMHGDVLPKSSKAISRPCGSVRKRKTSETKVMKEGRSSANPKQITKNALVKNIPTKPKQEDLNLSESSDNDE